MSTSRGIGVPPHARERGSALLISVFLAVAVMSWVTVVVQVNLSRRAHGRAMDAGVRANWLADSGIDLALFRISTGGGAGTWSEPLGDGTAEYTIRDLAPGARLIVARGISEQVVKVRRAIIRSESFPGYRWGLFGWKKLKMKEGHVDSWNPAEGSYEDLLAAAVKEHGYDRKGGKDGNDPNYHSKIKKEWPDAWVGGQGNVGSNGELKIEKSIIAGDVYVNPDADTTGYSPDKNGNGKAEGKVNGNKWKIESKEADVLGEVRNADATWAMPPVTRADITRVAAENDNDRIVVVEAGKKDYLKDGKKPGEPPTLHAHSGEYVLPEGTYYFKDLKVHKDAIIRTSGKVTIWVENKFEVKDGQFITGSGKAADLEIIVADFKKDDKMKEKDLKELRAAFGDDIPAEELDPMEKGEVKFKHGGVFVGTVYAPMSKVKIENRTDVFGSVVAKEVEVKKGGNFHYDESLMEGYIEPSVGGDWVSYRW